MAFFQELDELKKFILPCLILFLAFSILFFTFGISKIEVLGQSFYFISPASKSISAQFLGIMRQDLLSEDIRLITTNPLNAFLAQVVVSLFLALVLTLPYFLYKLIYYLSPALYGHEKRIIFKVLVPSIVLFGAGCLFAYFVLIPSTFNLLYSYAARVGAMTFFSINEFVTLVLAFTVATGIIFLLPIFMILLSRLGIVEAAFWKRNWRQAILVCLILSALITPDGTGITMLILSVPMAGLYFLGCVLS